MYMYILLDWNVDSGLRKTDITKVFLTTRSHIDKLSILVKCLNWQILSTSVPRIFFLLCFGHRQQHKTKSKSLLSVS